MLAVKNFNGPFIIPRLAPTPFQFIQRLRFSAAICSLYHGVGGCEVTKRVFNGACTSTEPCSIFYLACVAWRFWLGELSNKGGRGQRNREEVATPLLRPARQSRHATQAIFYHIDHINHSHCMQVRRKVGKPRYRCEIQLDQRHEFSDSVFYRKTKNPLEPKISVKGF